MEMAFNVTFFNSAKFFNNAQNQLEFTTETRFARYRSKFSLILGIKKKIWLRLKKFSRFTPLPFNKYPFMIFLKDFVQLNVSLLHCFCVLFNSFAKLYTHFWPFTSTSGGKIILQTLVVVITATSVCKMIFSILQPLVAVITATSVCNYSH